MNTTIARLGYNNKQDTLLYLIFFTLCLLLNNYLTLEFLYSDEIYYRSYGEQMAYDGIEKLLKFRDSLLWVSYLLVPVTLMVKMLFVSACINVGTLFLNYKIEFKKIFQAVIIAETIFIAASLTKTAYLVFFADIQNLRFVQYFYPLSLVNLLEMDSIPRWITYPLQLINAFELAYWLFLAWLLKPLLNRNYSSSLGFVASSYGVGLLIWVVLIVFLSVSFSS